MFGKMIKVASKFIWKKNMPYIIFLYECINICCSCWQSVGIEVRVTNEIPVVTTETNIQDAAPPWTTTSAPSRTTPPTPTNPQLHYLSPHVFHGRNSLCSANGKIRFSSYYYMHKTRAWNKSYIFSIDFIFYNRNG